MTSGTSKEDYSAVLCTMQLLNIIIGQRCKNFADGVNARRITRKNRRPSSSTKEARTARILETLNQNELFEEEERLLYGSGVAV